MVGEQTALPPIRPVVSIVGHHDGSATITARITFVNHDKAMEFNNLIVQFLLDNGPLLRVQTEQADTGSVT